jgi:pimeloyl-ACP methyl ester carboxylesterase
MKIRNLNFNVKVTGAGSPFVWAHGLMSSMAAEDELNWFQWGTFPQNLKLVRYDARGHGKTQATYRPDDYHWRSLGQDMLAVASAADARYFIAGGASMGCATALYAALQAPERIQGLVLVIPPNVWEKREPQGKEYQRMARIGGLLGGGLLARLSSRRMHEVVPGWLLAEEGEKLAGAREGLRSMSGRALSSVLRGAGLTDLPTREVLAAGLRDIPALILTWVDDPTHPVWSAEELSRHLPKSELFVAKGYADFQTIPQRIRRFVLTTIHYTPPPIHFE